MPAKTTPEGTYVEEIVPDAPDPVLQIMKIGIAFVVVTIVTVVLYAVLVGAFNPSSPRTVSESLLRRTKAAIEQNQKDGKSWAEYARALYLSGSKREARAAIADARKAVTDKSILWVNNVELDIMLREGDDEAAVKKAEEFVKKSDEIYLAETKKLEAQGIKIPAEMLDSDSTIQLYLLQATAQGNVGKYADAVKTLDKVMKLDPEAADALVMRGYAKLHAGDKDGAKTDFEKALTYLPDDANAQAGLKQATAK